MVIDSPDPLRSLQVAGRYGSGAIALHWAMFVLVAIVGTLGLLHDSWPKRTQAFWINVHALLGLLLWMMLLARFFWRARHAPPALPLDIGAFSRRLSNPVHWALYALMFVTPLLGIVTFIYHGRVFNFGVFQLDPGIKSDRAVREADGGGASHYSLELFLTQHRFAAQSWKSTATQREDRMDRGARGGGGSDTP